VGDRNNVGIVGSTENSGETTAIFMISVTGTINVVFD